MGAYPERGAEIKVQVVTDPDQRLYSSKLSDIKENSLIIELLLDPEEQSSLTPNEPLILYFSVPDHYYGHSIYEFKATILECHRERFIKITRPKETEITHFQRREFVRFYCNINATFKFISINKDGDNQIHKARITNLSAGGAALESKKEASPADVIELKFHYAEANIRPVDITVAGEVIRAGCSNTGAFTFAIKFTILNENDRRLIIDIADNYFRKLRKRLVFLK